MSDKQLKILILQKINTLVSRAEDMIEELSNIRQEIEANPHLVKEIKLKIDVIEIEKNNIVRTIFHLRSALKLL